MRAAELRKQLGTPLTSTLSDQEQAELKWVVVGWFMKQGLGVCRRL